MGRWITAIVGTVLFVILAAESLVSNMLEDAIAPNFKVPQLVAGVLVSLFVVLMVIWIGIAIRNRRQRSR